jgi:hypothetical protein
VRVSEKRLRQERQISKYEFGFMPGKLTVEALYLLWRLVEALRINEDLYMFFIGLKKAYDSVYFKRCCRRERDVCFSRHSLSDHIQETVSQSMFFWRWYNHCWGSREEIKGKLDVRLALEKYIECKFNRRQIS